MFLFYLRIHLCCVILRRLFNPTKKSLNLSQEIKSYYGGNTKHIIDKNTSYQEKKLNIVTLKNIGKLYETMKKAQFKLDVVLFLPYSHLSQFVKEFYFLGYVHGPDSYSSFSSFLFSYRRWILILNMDLDTFHYADSTILPFSATEVYEKKMNYHNYTGGYKNCKRQMFIHSRKWLNTTYW